MTYPGAMLIRQNNVSPPRPVGARDDVSLRCPACRHLGTLKPFQHLHDQPVKGPEGQFTLGCRLCPNTDCFAVLFVVLGDHGVPVASYPPERVDFDATNLPPGVLSSLEEAISCHSHELYLAAGMMVRRTLEELCADRQAQGNNLKERLRNLGSQTILPQELLDGLDDLRLLGNDAAHIKSRDFQQVGQEEVDIALDLTKEVLKAVYQYSNLLSRLRGLKRT